MARFFQFIGLPEEAKWFLKKNKAKQIGEQEFEEYFYMDGYAMKIYETPDGKKYYEYECACPWDSGPMLYLGLKNEKDEIISEWNKNFIGEYYDL